MSIAFTSLTRAAEIGANCYLLEMGGFSVALDCGIHPKYDGRDSLPRFDEIACGDLDAAVVTHAHLDHVGALPLLMRRHPGAPVFMTEATGAFGEAMLHNSVNVMTAKRTELGITEYPYFTHKEVDRLADGWRYPAAGRSFDIGGGVRAEFFESGHILGAAGVLLRFDGQQVFYTGDVHFEDQSLSRAADFPDGPIDTLILETTRGSAERCRHYTRAAEKARLAEAIGRTLDRGGAALIPVFALGKTQELLRMLHELRDSGEIPHAPIHIGGLGAKMSLIADRFSTRVRRQHEGFRLMQDIGLELQPRKKRRRELRYEPGHIYALSSGMMTENTVSNGFARYVIDNPRDAILFVGYADPQSPAGVIRSSERGDPIQLAPDVPPCDLRCDVEEFDFSAHAPREALRDYANKVRPKTILLVHGDPEATAWFKAKLGEDMPGARIVVPEPLERIAIG